MTSAQQKTIEEPAMSSTSDAAVSDVLTAWDRVFQGVKAQVRTNANLVAADFRLSFKAVIVTLFCVLILVGLGLVVWITVLAGLAYGLTSYGFHWLWSLLLVLVLNIIVWFITKEILTSAINSIKMKATANLLFLSDNK